MGDLDHMIVDIDAEGTIRWVSPAARTVLGHDPDALIGGSVTTLSERDIPAYRTGWPNLVARPGATFRGVVSAIAADGGERRLEVVAKNCLGTPEVAGIVAHCSDVTSEYRTQQALAASRLELEEACRMAHVGAWSWDARTDEIRMSRLMLDLLGWQSQPALRWQDLRPLILPPDDLPEPSATLRRIAEAEGIDETEHRILRADGATRLWAVRARAYRDAEGRPESVVGTVMDVTEDRQKEQELIRAEKLEALDLLSAGIAHDFNNLLAVILGNVSLARMELGSDPDPSTDKALFDAQIACQQAGRLAEQLFSFARGTLPEGFRTLDVGQIVHSAVPFLLHGTRVQGDVDVADPLPPVLGDAAQLGQALQNLVLNAVAAMPEGGRLTVQAEPVDLPLAGRYLDLPPGRYVGLTIADTGQGIARENLDHIFDPYFTTRQGGHGMGLTTTERIVRGHGGRITVTSDEGSGTTFRVYIPAAQFGEAAATQDDPPSGVRSLLTGTRILVVDAEDLLRSVMGGLVSRLGGRVTECASSGEAEKCVREALAAGEPFHVAIVDFTLPDDVSGVEIVRRLRAIDPAIRAIIASGYAKARTVTKYHRMGFRVVLPKPFTPEQLESALSEALSRSTRVRGRRRTDRGPAQVDPHGAGE